MFYGLKFGYSLIVSWIENGAFVIIESCREILKQNTQFSIKHILENITL